mmetsp:Transcript_42682/g.86300  ORF Transcript_42682/g.86300 Transcript_42682/m.86300 type:complete len:148 (-) Transcript_42682:528-971(-)
MAVVIRAVEVASSHLLSHERLCGRQLDVFPFSKNKNRPLIATCKPEVSINVDVVKNSSRLIRQQTKWHRIWNALGLFEGNHCNGIPNEFKVSIGKADVELRPACVALDPCLKVEHATEGISEINEVVEATPRVAKLKRLINTSDLLH